MSTTPKNQPEIITNESLEEPKKPTFEETFRPFRVKKGTDLAPSNYFRAMKGEIIVLDDEGEEAMKIEQTGAPKGKVYISRASFTNQPPCQIY